jgi:cytochrome c-type biogenesis protein CcsB
MAIATFIEKYWGTEAAKVAVYHSPLFFLLQLFLVINFIAASLRRRLFKRGKWGFLAIHFSLIIILAGALTSHIFGKEGVVHLRETERLDYMLVQTNKGNSRHPLPFSIELTDFTMARYPGSASPSSFESLIRIHDGDQSFERKISMNNVLDYKGYRFFQSSYDRDERGTILSVNQDAAGRAITYSGYAVLILGFVLCFTGKNTRFRQLVRNLKQMKKAAAMLALLLSGAAANAQHSTNDLYNLFQKNAIPAEHAARFGALPMQSLDGRLEPVNTFASEALRKLHRADKVGNLNADQFLLSLLTMPEMWMQIPFISLKNKDIARHYGLTAGQCAYVELFDDDDNYKLQRDLDAVFAKPPAARSRFDKDLIKLDEQINIFYRLAANDMVNIFPEAGDPNHTWTASHELLYGYLAQVAAGLKTGDWTAADDVLRDIRRYQTEHTTLAIDHKKLDTERRYNRLNIFRQCKKIYLMAGGILLVLAFISLFKKNKAVRAGIYLLTAVVSAGLLCHLSGMALRGYIAGYAPWSNAYETMVYVAFITVAAGFLFVRQSAITLALATIFGGVILFVSGLNWIDPQISPLVPVLKSPWLMIHVAVIVAAYGFFGIGFLLGLTNHTLLFFNKKNRNDILTRRVNELTLINEMALWAGLALMTIGSFVGAIWANESWGRYWGWDPKETWALITVVVYAVTLHVRLLKKLDNPRVLNLLSILAFAAVLMTYFGVNYYLSGMHSYGS